jgi:putative hemolysin
MKNKNKIRFEIFLCSLVFFLALSIASAIKEPSSAFCQQMGYTITVENSPEGQIGICKFSQSQNCSTYSFLLGKCGQKYHYCTKMGYGLKTVNSSENCSIPFSEECAVCIKDGEEISAIEMMGLDLSEGYCGDKACTIGEDKYTCPSDCNMPQSGILVASGKIAGTCENECSEQGVNICGEFLYDCLPDRYGCLKIRNKRTCWETEECVDGIGCVESVPSKGFWSSLITILDKVRSWFR